MQGLILLILTDLGEQLLFSQTLIGRRFYIILVIQRQLNASATTGLHADAALFDDVAMVYCRNKFCAFRGSPKSSIFADRET